MWIDESVLTHVPGKGSSRRGRPCVYADAVIQMLLGLKQVFRLPLRALQGFAQSLRALGFAGLPVPNLHDTKPSRAGVEGRVARDPQRRAAASACRQHRGEALR